jgi:hypothetical protein
MDEPAWDRCRLQILLGVSALVFVALIAGAAWSLTTLLHGDSGHHGSAPTASSRAADDRTAEPGGAGFTPGPISTDRAQHLAIPQPRGLGPIQVATGFPRSPNGALAQLIAIDRRAIESASVVTAQGVIERWAAPGGPSPASWSGVKAVAILLESAGLPADGSSDLQVELRPAMALIHDPSPKRATPCVDFVMSTSALGATPSRVAVSDCQHMVWSGGRWMIGPGAEAASPPSVWPGSRSSYISGYRWIETVP